MEVSGQYNNQFIYLFKLFHLDAHLLGVYVV